MEGWEANRINSKKKVSADISCISCILNIYGTWSEKNKMQLTCCIRFTILRYETCRTIIVVIIVTTKLLRQENRTVFQNRLAVWFHCVRISIQMFNLTKVVNMQVDTDYGKHHETTNGSRQFLWCTDNSGMCCLNKSQKRNSEDNIPFSNEANKTKKFVPATCFFPLITSRCIWS